MVHVEADAETADGSLFDLLARFIHQKEKKCFQRSISRTVLRARK